MNSNPFYIIWGVVTALLASYDEAPAYFDNLAEAVMGPILPADKPDTAWFCPPGRARPR